MLTDNQIIDGFRRGDSRIMQDYFYDYCRTAWFLFDRRYDLASKENLDFMSLAHQYAIYLMEHDWRPLEDHSPQVSLRTWMINGFHFVVLDALKWYKREYGSITFEDYLKTFDTSQDLRINFNKLITDICDNAHLDRNSKTILMMLLVEGYKTKEVAALMGISSSAVSQRYTALKENVVAPYIRKFFNMDSDTPEVMVTTEISECTPSYAPEASAIPMEGTSRFSIPKWSEPSLSGKACHNIPMEKKRTTPENIQELEPNEIFVFGSNLRGIHGGGAAYVAYRRFGAIMGQGVGLQGQSYAIPTMQGGVETIRPHVDDFIRFASHNPQLTFLVTRIGCGIAGFTDSQIAPLFAAAHSVPNIVLPEGW